MGNGLSGEFSGDYWSLSADISYQLAERDNVWSPVLLSQWEQVYSFDFRDTPSVIALEQGPNAPQSASLELNSLTGEYAELRDELTAARFDLNYSTSYADLSSVDVGMRFSNREKQERWWDYNLAEASGNAFTNPVFPDGLLSAYSISQFTATPFLNASSYDQLANLVYGGEFVQDYQSYASERASSYWKVTEQTSAAYVKANFDGEMFGVEYTADAGLRYESLRLQSFDAEANSIENHSGELLPSATLNLILSEQKIIRLAFARAIARPALDELRAGAYIDVSQGTANAGTGNPTLIPMGSNQIDFSFEWYFATESLFALAVYYKDIDDYIGVSSVSVPNSLDQTVTVISAPANGEGGSIQGLELTFQMPFAAGFGVYSNVSFVNSDIVENTPERNPYAIAGAADSSATLDFWYSEGPFEARLGWKYHSEYTTGFDWGGELKGLEPEQNVSLSLSYAISRNLSVRVQGNNLTDEALTLTQQNNRDILNRYDVYGKTFNFDLTWKM